MSKQMTLGTGFEKYSKTTRREKFLTEMDCIVPWGGLSALGLKQRVFTMRDATDHAWDTEIQVRCHSSWLMSRGI